MSESISGLGSVAALSNSSGSIAESYSYDVFGYPGSTSGLGNPYMFTGQRYDSETGLYYYKARYYNPYIGRFLQTDPVGYYYTMNLYEYCWNDPVNWIDPYGLFNITIGGGRGLAGSIEIGRNSGQWSVKAHIGIGAGFYIGLDGTDTGRTRGGNRGVGVHTTFEGHGQAGKFGIGGRAEAGGLFMAGGRADSHFGIHGSIGPFSGHATGEIFDKPGGGTGYGTGLKGGGTVGAGALGMMGAGVEAAWGGGDGDAATDSSGGGSSSGGGYGTGGSADGESATSGTGGEKSRDTYDGSSDPDDYD